MTYPRDNVPLDAGLRVLKSYLERTLSDIDAWASRIDAQVATLTRVAELNGVVINWKWSDVLDTSIDPGAQNMTGNNQILSAITQFAFSNVDLYQRGLDGSQLNQVTTNDTVTVGDLEKNAFFIYTMDAPIVDMGTWFQLDVTPIEGGSANPVIDDMMEGKWLPNLTPPIGPAGLF